MSDTRKKKSGFFVWLVMGLLVLGLGGFGLSGAFQTTGGSTVAIVGAEEITADQFLKAMQQDINRTSSQLGQPVSFSQARLFGIDKTSLRRQVTLAALANEARRLNLSVGDQAVREALLSNPAFQVGGGVFSEATYDLVLQQQRMTRAEFENLLRVDQTQNLMSGAVSGAVGPQTTPARVLLDYLGTRRDITWAEITPENTPSAITAVDEASARAYYDENPDMFTIPETRVVTYATISPALLAEGIDIPEADIRALFEARQATLNAPARRIVERIIFPSSEEAAAAMARITAGEASFSDIAEAQGLTADETNIGLVRATQLSSAAADLLFGTEETGVYGPVEANLGPAIFKINAVIAENIVPFDDVKEGLRNELALQKAQSLVLTMAGDIEDLIAGGATLEELAAETDMVLEHINVNDNTPIANDRDSALVAEARAAAVGEERDLVELGNGEIVAVRVDEIIPPRLQPYEEVSDAANAAATLAANAKSAKAYADELKAQVEAGADLAASLSTVGLTAQVESNVTRTNPPTGLPPETGLALFDLAENAVAVYPADNSSFIVQINKISPFDAESESGKAFLAQAEAQVKSDIADDLYNLYANGIVANTDITINQGMIDQILASVAR
jgi:peptidyl-prolyl cis-trans isomerase D